MTVNKTLGFWKMHLLFYKQNTIWEELSISFENYIVVFYWLLFLPPIITFYIKRTSPPKYCPLFCRVFSAMERCEPAVGPGGLRRHQKDQSSLHWHLAAWSGSLQQVRYRRYIWSVPLFTSLDFTLTSRNNHRTWEGCFYSHSPILQYAPCESSDFIEPNVDVWQCPSPFHMLHLTHCFPPPTTSPAATAPHAKLGTGWLGLCNSSTDPPSGTDVPPR